MFKKPLIQLLILLPVATGIFGFENMTKLSQSRLNKEAYRNNPVPRNWKTYTNEPYGFSFRYPPAFSQQGRESEIIDLSGKLKAIEINFFDSKSNSELLVAYHFAPDGAKLYQYAISEYRSSKTNYEKGSKELKINGNNALEAITGMSVNGKGDPIEPPLRLIIVDILDKQKTGDIQLQFRTPLPNAAKGVADFQLLLSSFRFTDKAVH